MILTSSRSLLTVVNDQCRINKSWQIFDQSLIARHLVDILHELFYIDCILISIDKATFYLWPVNLNT